MAEKINGYTYSRQWYDFALSNPDLVSPGHGAMYLWFVELNNRLGWARKFASPASQTMAAAGIKSYTTYKKIFDELVGFGFVEIIEQSRNQWTACIIALPVFVKAPVTALGEAHVKAREDHLLKQQESTCESSWSINKPETNNKKHNNNNIKSELIPPTLDEVILFFKEKNFSEALAKKAFEYYEAGEWKDQAGKKVKNWKQKMIAVWMKEENKETEPTGRITGIATAFQQAFEKKHGNAGTLRPASAPPSQNGYGKL